MAHNPAKVIDRLWLALLTLHEHEAVSSRVAGAGGAELDVVSMPAPPVEFTLEPPPATGELPPSVGSPPASGVPPAGVPDTDAGLPPVVLD